MRESKLKSLLTFFLGWPLSLIALGFLGKFIFTSGYSVMHAISSLNYMLLTLGQVSFLGYFFFRALFWHSLLEKKGYKFTILHSFVSWSIAELQRYVPGNIWAVVGRAKAYKEKGIPIKVTVGLQTQELLYMLAATLFLSLFSVYFIVYGILPFVPLQAFLAKGSIVLICIFLLLFVFSARIGKKVWARIPLFYHIFPQESAGMVLQLLLLMISSFFCFGLGTYFSISSLSLLYPNHVISLIGFFVTSFLLGFLSFITPMGLGVREGIITVGISKYFNSLQKAATGALIARVCLVVSELAFLIILLGIARIPVRVKAFFRTLWTEHKYTVLLSIGIAIYIVYFSGASFLRYTNFYTGRFDLGNMDQTVWNTVHGRIFQLTDPDGTNIISRLSIHADFILVLLAPFYLLWQDPRMLLLIQTLVLASGSIFVYILARDVLKNKRIAFILGLCFLLNPAVQHSNLYDFHAVVLATTFLLGAFYFLYKRKFLPFLLFGILAGITKEETWAVVGLLGLFDSLRNRQYIRGILTLVIGVAFSYTLVDKIIPLARGGDHFALSYYADLGSTPLGIIKAIFLSPQKVIPILFKNGRPLYFLELFSPLCFFSLLSPIFLIFAGPDLAINVLSNNNQLHQIYYQYTANVTPFLFISAIFGIRFFQRKYPNVSLQTIGFFIVFSSILSAYTFGPLFGSMQANIDMFIKPQANGSEIEEFLQNIPKKYSVAATNNIGSHLSHRQQIYTIPNGIDKADVLVFLLNDQFAQPSLPAQKQMVLHLIKDPRYSTVFAKGDFYVFEKKSLLPITKKRHSRHFPLLFSLSHFFNLNLF